MRKVLFLAMGLCAAAPVMAAANADLAASLARSYAEMDIADAVTEACPGLFADERAMDAEEDRLVREIAAVYGPDKVEAVMMSPTLEAMMKREQMGIVAEFDDMEQLCVAGATGGVRFVTPRQPAPADDEVEDTVQPGDEPVLSPLGSFW